MTAWWTKSEAVTMIACSATGHEWTSGEAGHLTAAATAHACTDTAEQLSADPAE